MAHLSYDTNERIAKDPRSGTHLSDKVHVNCLTCEQGKQTKNDQSKKYTGTNSAIERIGGVICSDLRVEGSSRKSVQKDRLGNRCLINFVDHKSNYCRVL